MNYKSAILVGININSSEYDFKNSLEELKGLCISLGIENFHYITQNRDKYDPKFLIGSGKAQEVNNLVLEKNIDLVLFNDTLSGSQLNNLSENINAKIMDRSAIILDIFAKRANTRLAKLQIKLAKLNYKLPRLKGYGNELSKLGAGIGTRGPGEQKLELDKRSIRKSILDIKRRISKMEKTRHIQRKQRLSSNIPIVSLVGYSNVGKSTLFNYLVENYGQDEDKVYVDDLLFATLDTHVSKISLDNNKEFILIDTIGFISKLPHFLIDAFKATLEEVKTSDLILNIIDFNSENTNTEIEITQDILKQLDALSIPRFTVYNKIDKFENIDNSLDKKIKISAKKGLNIDKLLEKIQKELFSDYQNLELLLPFNKANLVSNLHENFNVDFEKYTQNGIVVSTEVDQLNYNKLKKYEISNEKFLKVKNSPKDI
ncbi:MAG: GTPase HflX [Bacillota bacterium]